MSDNTNYRSAKAMDSRFIAEMIDISSDGVALIEWTDAAQVASRQTTLDIGAGLYASDKGNYSYNNCILAEVSGVRAGMLLSFPMHAKDLDGIVLPPPFDGTDVFAPYKYLETPDTWYICGIAVTPEHRRHGIGKRLMQIAREQAREHGYDQLSLVVFEENAAAVRLYRHLGYEIIKSAPVVPHPLIRCCGDALLMVAPSS